MKYMHAIGQHEHLSLANGLVAGADVQPGGQVENHFAGDASVQKKKKKRIVKIRISKLKIECQPTERIIEYSGPALVPYLCLHFFVVFFCREQKLVHIANVCFSPVCDRVCIFRFSRREKLLWQVGQ